MQAKNKMCVVDVQPEVGKGRCGCGGVTSQLLSTSLLNVHLSATQCSIITCQVPAGSGLPSGRGCFLGGGGQQSHHICWPRADCDAWLPTRRVLGCFLTLPLLCVNPPPLQALRRLRTAEFKPYVIFVKPRIPESRRRRSAATSPGGGEHGRVTVSFVASTNVSCSFLCIQCCRLSF